MRVSLSLALFYASLLFLISQIYNFNMRTLLATLLLLASTVHVRAATETPVEIIPLAPPLDQADAELSGLTWCGDKLILMPQYPRRLNESKISYFYYLEKTQIVNYLDGGTKAPLQAKKIVINEKDLRKAVTIFDGFEAIACDGEHVWLSIEAITLLGTYQSFVVPGSIEFGDSASLNIDETRLVKLETQSNMRNMGDEAILLDGAKIIAMHEINDSRVVAKPKARRVNRRGEKLVDLTFPNLPFRITDATSLDSQKRFWTINYKYSGDKFSRDANDHIAEKYGQGESHKKYYNVERLVEFELRENSIHLVTSSPIQLKMEDVEGRNWEGIARLGQRGFLIATDKHPETLLGFVPSP